MRNLYVLSGFAFLLALAIAQVRRAEAACDNACRERQYFYKKNPAPPMGDLVTCLKQEFETCYYCYSNAAYRCEPRDGDYPQGSCTNLGSGSPNRYGISTGYEPFAPCSTPCAGIGANVWAEGSMVSPSYSYTLYHHICS